MKPLTPRQGSVLPVAVRVGDYLRDAVVVAIDAKRYDGIYGSAAAGYASPIRGFAVASRRRHHAVERRVIKVVSAHA